MHGDNIMNIRLNLCDWTRKTKTCRLRFFDSSGLKVYAQVYYWVPEITTAVFWKKKDTMDWGCLYPPQIYILETLLFTEMVLKMEVLGVIRSWGGALDRITLRRDEKSSCFITKWGYENKPASRPLLDTGSCTDLRLCVIEPGGDMFAVYPSSLW